MLFDAEKQPVAAEPLLKKRNTFRQFPCIPPVGFSFNATRGTPLDDNIPTIISFRVVVIIQNHEPSVVISHPPSRVNIIISTSPIHSSVITLTIAPWEVIDRDDYWREYRRGGFPPFSSSNERT